MTVGDKLKQTLASAESVAANLRQFSLDTKDQQAQQAYNQLADTMDNAVQQLRSRLAYIQSEEPQYGGNAQAQQRRNR